MRVNIFRPIFILKNESLTRGIFRKACCGPPNKKNLQNRLIRLKIQIRILFLNAERKSTVFSSQSMVVVGGSIDGQILTLANSDQTKSEALQNISSSFRGKMNGFFFNDVKVFDLAAESKQRLSCIYALLTCVL